MEIANTRFSSLLNVVIIGWTVGVTTIFWIFLVIGLLLSFVAGTGIENNQGISAVIAIPVMFVLAPVIAFFQSIIISAICYLGILVYRKIKKL